MLELAATAAAGCGAFLDLILWVIAAVLVIWGIVTLFRGAILMGILLIAGGLLVGPGGVSLIC